jgi:hypothetical protein
MSNFKVPKHTEQIIPKTENLLKSIVLISLLIGSCFLIQLGVNAIDTYSATASTYLLWLLKGILILPLAIFNALLITDICLRFLQLLRMNSLI